MSPVQLPGTFLSLHLPQKPQNPWANGAKRSETRNTSIPTFPRQSWNRIYLRFSFFSKNEKNRKKTFQIVASCGRFVLYPFVAVRQLSFARLHCNPEEEPSMELFPETDLCAEQRGCFLLYLSPTRLNGILLYTTTSFRENRLPSKYLKTSAPSDCGTVGLGDFAQIVRKRLKVGYRKRNCMGKTPKVM